MSSPKKSKSKYAAIMPMLPNVTEATALPPEKLDFNARVEQLIEELRKGDDFDGGTESLIKAYRVLRRRKEKLREEVKDVELVIEAHVRMLYQSHAEGAELWGEYGVTDMSCRLQDGSTFRLQPEPVAVIEDKDKHREWVMKDEVLVSKMILPWAITNALVKEMALAGKEAPDGVKLFKNNKVVFTDKGGEVDIDMPLEENNGE